MRWARAGGTLHGSITERHVGHPPRARLQGSRQARVTVSPVDAAGLPLTSGLAGQRAIGISDPSTDARASPGGQAILLPVERPRQRSRRCIPWDAEFGRRVPVCFRPG